MRGKLSHWVLPPTWLRFLIVVLLILGVFFRFVNLDKKVYWLDETYTSLRISGYTETEAAQQVSDGKILSLEDLQKYQRPNPEKSVVNTIKGLAAEEPQVTPLYFVMARFWAQMFGSSVAVTRSLSAFISLLAFPCIYWLCVELFESSLTGWLAIALLAVSPFQVIYAQEARQYSLWTVTILLSSAALLRAMRLKTKTSWGIYAATVAVGLYSHLFATLVSLSHGIYVLATERFRGIKTLTAYLLSSLAGFVAFSPWIAIVLTNLSQISRATPEQSQKIKESLFSLGKSWVGNLSRNFVDFGFNSDSPLASPLTSLIPLIVTILLVLILVGYSIYFLCRHTSQRVWLFLLTLIGIPFLALVLPDLILGGRRSILSRYMIPTYLGIQLAVAYLLSSKISLLSVNIRRKLWQLTLISITLSGILSCAISSQAEIWWNKRTNSYNREFAQIINQASRPLLINEISTKPPYHSIFKQASLSPKLNPKVQFQFVVEKTVPKIPNGFSDVFIIDPSDVTKAGIEKQYNSKLERMDRNQESELWKLAKPSNGLETLPSKEKRLNLWK